MNNSRFRNALLVLYVLVGVAWSVSIPTFEAGDEPAHLEHVRFIAKEKRLAVILPPPHKPVGEGFQPPLYYAALAAVRQAFFGTNETPSIQLRPDWKNDDRGCSAVWYQHHEEERFPFAGIAHEVHLLRLCSVFIGLIALWFLHQSLVTVFPDTSVVPCVALAWAAFLPGFTFITAVLSNDGLATALSAVAMAQAVRMVQGGRPLREWAWLGGVAGLGVLGKLTTVPISAGLCLALLWYERRNWRRGVACGGCFAAGLLAVSGWWFARNWILYHDPIGWNVAVMVNPWTVLPPGYWSGERVLKDAHVCFSSYWGVFGYLSVSMNHWIYRALYGVTLLGLLCAGWWIRREWRHWPDSTRRGVMVMLAAMAVGIVTLICQCARNRLAQGRYLFPGYPAHALVVAMAAVCLGHVFMRRPVWVARLACCLAGGLGAVLVLFRGPLLAATANGVRQWFNWKPRTMTIEFYLNQGRWLYETGTGIALGVALAAGVLWAWQARRARENGEEAVARWWQERRFGLAMGWGLLMAGLNIFCLVKYLLPAYR